MKQTLRAGSRIHQNKEVPNNAKIFRIKSGQECYLSSIKYENFKYTYIIYVFELQKFVDVSYDKIEKYL